MKNRDCLLIHKFLSGEITEGEKLEFDYWLSSDAKNQQQFEAIKLVWDHCAPAGDAFDYDPKEELQKIRSRMTTA